MSNISPKEIYDTKDPQRESDEKLIRRSISGLTLYAAQYAQADPESPRIAEIRGVIENLAGYWGLDDFSADKLQRSFLMPVDFLTEVAKSGVDLAENPNEHHLTVIFGLYRHCEDLVCSQGAEAKSEIIAIRELVSEIVKLWDFDSHEHELDSYDFDNFTDVYDFDEPQMDMY